MPAADLIDWNLAVTTARRLAPSGPAVPAGEAAEAVAALRVLAEQAAGHVETYTRMHPLVTTGVAVVDRGEWIASNAASMQVLVAPLIDKLARTKSRPSGVDAIGRRVTGVEVGGLLAFLSSKVLGQYEPFLPAGPDGVTPAGRLTLVAPNIVGAERSLGVVPADFRLWVCLHEQTHRTQFTAVPWLRGYMQGLVAQFVEASELDAAALVRRLAGAARSVVERRESLVEALQTPAQREVLGRITALMTLLEGHAEHVMDAVGPQVVPTVAQIRDRFDDRRNGGSPIDRVLRRLLGLDAKMRQYRDGASFVAAVVGEVGIDGFNRVWESEQTLPLPAEIATPRDWVTRVLA